eukprot:gnl/Hemi2/26495_TR8891_c0_g1_i1.p2 gnl/Hemi2/26495_TR8891_c0_g1~~gnl/Hemi2/26495_TR8891_c0_g1_i1.p2  ORF type:complete len:163 (-),score=61.92 gnl/Hemi2/26495_TR8891_c0_g1_i1:236-724(-)
MSAPPPSSSSAVAEQQPATTTQEASITATPTTTTTTPAAAQQAAAPPPAPLASLNPEQKALRLKLGIVKRVKKELEGYKAQAVKDQDRVEKAKVASPDSVRQLEGVASETIKMVADTEHRLAAAFDELRSLVDSVAEDETCNATEDFSGAKALLAEVDAARA